MQKPPMPPISQATQTGRRGVQNIIADFPPAVGLIAGMFLPGLYLFSKVEPSQNFPWFFLPLSIGGLATTLLGLVFGRQLNAWCFYRFWKDPKKHVQVKTRITHSHLVFKKETVGSSGGTTWYVRYEFEFDGRAYWSAHYRFDEQEVSNTFERIDQFVELYPVGAEVTAYFYPYFPTASALTLDKRQFRRFDQRI
jgi:hypothetical protein